MAFAELITQENLKAFGAAVGAVGALFGAIKGLAFRTTPKVTDIEGITCLENLTNANSASHPIVREALFRRVFPKSRAGLREINALLNYDAPLKAAIRYESCSHLVQLSEKGDEPPKFELREKIRRRFLIRKWGNLFGYGVFVAAGVSLPMTGYATGSYLTYNVSTWISLCLFLVAIFFLAILFLRDYVALEIAREMCESSARSEPFVVLITDGS
jgi:uncharacterized membrane protein (Fun14 family)